MNKIHSGDLISFLNYSFVAGVINRQKTAVEFHTKEIQTQEEKQGKSKGKSSM